MPRPKINQKEKRINLGVTVSPKAFAKTERIAKKQGKTRSFIVDEILINHKP